LRKRLCFKILRIRHGWYFFRARTFRAAARRFRPDVVHGMEALSYGYATARCGGFARVLTPWGVDILHDPKQSRVARWLVTHALRNVEAITTNMPNLAEVAVKEFGADPSACGRFRGALIARFSIAAMKRNARRCASDGRLRLMPWCF
jgi:hypothetical protein